MLQWFVAKVAPGREYRVRDELLERALDANPETAEPFLPELQETRVYKRTRVTYRHIGPLFPTYLFVRFDPEAPWLWLNGLRGVTGIIRRDDAPVPVRSGRVDWLRDKATPIADGWRTRYLLKERDLLPEKRSKFHAKQKLVIGDGGVFDGRVAQYVADADGVVTLDLDFLGRNVRLKVSEALVTAA